MYYDKHHKIQQCFNCQMYKHIARYCKRDPTCAYYAQGHDSGDCPRARDRTIARCVVYVRNKQLKDDHFAFDRSCPFRASALEEARNYQINGPQYHQAAYRLTPEESDPGSQPQETTPEITTIVDPDIERTPRTMKKTPLSRNQKASKSTSRPAKKPAASKSRSQARPEASNIERYSAKKPRGNDHDVMEADVEYIFLPSSPAQAPKPTPKGTLSHAALSSVGARQWDRSLRSSKHAGANDAESSKDELSTTATNSTEQ
jgi:hypothetical protein